MGVASSGYFICSLFFFPLALLVAYVVEDRTRPAFAQLLTDSLMVRGC